MDEYNQYSMYMVTTDDLIRRLKDAITGQMDVNGKEAIKDAIVYIQKYYFINF